MISKKAVILFVILAVFLIAGASFFLDKNFSPRIWFPSGAKIIIQDQQITDNTKPFKIAITYPQIAGLEDFNQKAKAIVDKEIADFKKNSLENDTAVKAVDPISYAKYPRTYELNIGYDKGQIDNNIVSVIFNVYNFEGGAHGASYFVPLNFNVKTNQEVKLVDLFPGQSDYLQKISAFCTQDLTKQLTKALDSLDGTYLADGAGPKAENFQFFLINPSTSSGQATITFYFTQYQVAYGSAGDFKVIFPR